MRRFWTGVALAFLASACGGGGSGGSDSGPPPPPTTTQFYPPGATIPVSGPDVQGAAAFDQGVMALMRKWNIPGVAVSVARGGQLILARGYGYADFEAQQTMQPGTMTRVGSVSKTLTAIAILQLRDRGLLSLDQTFMSILTEYQVGAGGDARLPTITVRELLQHSGGWNKTETTDFLANPSTVASALGISTAVTCPDTIRYAMTQMLDFAPGAQFGYSSLGYCILSEIVARLTSESYEAYVRANILAPASVYAMSLGFAPLSQRGPYEAKYYLDGAVAPYRTDFAHAQGAGAWIASAVDLTRVMNALDGINTLPLISVDTRAQMLANPNLPDFLDYSGAGATWYGFGLDVGPTNQSYGHGGLSSGSQTLLWHRADGYTFAILTNSAVSDTVTFTTDLYTTMSTAVNSGFGGSSTDLYPQFPSPELPASGQ